MVIIIITYGNHDGMFFLMQYLKKNSAVLRFKPDVA